MASPALHPSARRFVPTTATVTEIEAAISLVAAGSVRTVRLSGLRGAERVAAGAMRRAREAGVLLRVERATSGRAVVTVGPTVPRGVPG